MQNCGEIVHLRFSLRRRNDFSASDESRSSLCILAPNDVSACRADFARFRGSNRGALVEDGYRNDLGAQGGLFL